MLLRGAFPFITCRSDTVRKVLFILGQLEDVDVEWMARAGQKRTIEPGQAIITQGQALDALFFVLEGECEVYLLSGKVLARLGSGEILGELSFVDAAPPSASVRAVARTRVLAVPKRKIEERLRQDTTFAARFYKAIAIFLSDRLRAMVSAAGGGAQPGEGGLQPDELDPSVLDHLHQAGARFDAMLRKLQT
jgi:CRP-like cAMP-binding protein